MERGWRREGVEQAEEQGSGAAWAGLQKQEDLWVVLPVALAGRRTEVLEHRSLCLWCVQLCEGWKEAEQLPRPGEGAEGEGRTESAEEGHARLEASFPGVQLWQNGWGCLRWC